MSELNPGIWISMLLMLAFSAFFSASETAISSINKIRVQNRAQSGDKKAAVALKNAQNYDHTLSTILIGNNVVKMCIRDRFVGIKITRDAIEEDALKEIARSIRFAD